MSLAALLNRRVTIQAPIAGQDATGAPLQGWTDFATVWAGVIDVSGREFLAATAAQNAVETKITIRHLDGVVPYMRVMHDSAFYNIQAVLGQDNRTLLLMCSRGVSNG